MLIKYHGAFFLRKTLEISGSELVLCSDEEPSEGHVSRKTLTSHLVPANKRKCVAVSSYVVTYKIFQKNQ